MFLPLLALAVSIAGIVFITLGLRGRPTFASPRCRKCGYDLRNMQFMSDAIGNCPECGTPLAGPSGVSFGRWERRPRQVVLGVVLLAVPWLAAIPANYIAQRTRGPMPGPGGLAAQTTPAILAALPKSMNSPWEWQELEARLKAGKLPTTDVDSALAALAGHLNTNRAAGRPRQPLHWVNGFVGAVIANKSASPAAVDALCQAYYGAAPPFTMREVARDGEPIPIVLNQFDPGDLNGMRQCWSITAITAADGTKLAPQQRFNQKGPLTADALSGTGRDGELHAALLHGLPPGEHEITFAYECAVLPDSATFVGLDGKPGTPEKWPATAVVTRWKTDVKRKITVVPKDASLVALVTDEARNPFTSSTISVEHALARPASKGVELVIKWKVTGEPSPVAAYHVWLQAGAEKIDYGTLIVGRKGDGTINSFTPRKTVSSLTPDAKAAEHHLDLDEIWGEPLEISGVKLDRFDLGGPR